MSRKYLRKTLERFDNGLYMHYYNNKGAEMQLNILIKNKEVSERIQSFKEKSYPHMPLTKLFIHAVMELIKKEDAK